MRQFLDIGSGLPTLPNLHEVVQGVAPESRVVYVDNDPIVLSSARALLTSTPEGRTAYLDADLNDAAAIIGAAEVRETLDLSRPVALSLIAILQFVVDEQRAHAIIDRLLAPLAPGSMLVIDPGVVLVSHWHPAHTDTPVPDEHVHMYGAVAVKR